MPSTRRQAIADALRRPDPIGLRELSQEVRLSEREVATHLAHVARSLRDERLVTEAATCTDCDFRFEKRDRFTRPGRCPRCGGNRIDAPRWRIEPRGG